MGPSLASALFREVRPEFFRLLSGPAAPLYIDTLDALERIASQQAQGIERDDAVALVEEVVERHADVPLDESVPVSLSTRDKARTVLDLLRRAGWLEEEERTDWKKLVHFHPNGLAMVQTLRKIA